MDIKQVNNSKLLATFRLSDSISSKEGVKRDKFSTIAVDSTDYSKNNDLNLSKKISEIDAITKNNINIVANNTATDFLTETINLLDNLDILVREANVNLEEQGQDIIENIRQNIKSIDNVVNASNDIPPLDPIDVIVNQELGKSLNLLLPDAFREEIKLGGIKFFPKDALVETIQNIRNANNKTASLLADIKDSELEISNQNRASTTSLLRDIDIAVNSANKVSKAIVNSPTNAINSFLSNNNKFIKNILSN
jgi:hypothetical protein